MVIAVLAVGIAVFVGIKKHQKKVEKERLSKIPYETVDRSAQVAIQKGLDWLASKQKENGAWSMDQFPALTALPLQAYAGAEHTNSTTVQKAVKFVLSNVQTNGGIYKESRVPGMGGLSTFNTAISMTSLHSMKRPEFREIILNARKFIAESQLEGDPADAGGFGYSQSGMFNSGDMMNSSYAIEAMYVTRDVEDLRTNSTKRVDLNWDAAIKFAEKMQNKESAGEADAGGFYYKPDKSSAGTTNAPDGKVIFRSYGTMTYVGLLSMSYANLTKDDPRIRSTISWATKHWTLEENPGLGNEGMYFFYYVLARGLKAAGIKEITAKDGTKIDWKKELAKKIMSLQHTDGSWFNINGRYWEADPILVTSYCIIALEITQEP